ncbi:unnamed protein product [Urochloa humidicola]
MSSHWAGGLSSSYPSPQHFMASNRMLYGSSQTQRANIVGARRLRHGDITRLKAVGTTTLKDSCSYSQETLPCETQCKLALSLLRIVSSSGDAEAAQAVSREKGPRTSHTPQRQPTSKMPYLSLG